MIPVVSIIHNSEPIDEQTFRFLLRFSPIEKQQRILRQRIKQNADNMVIGGALARHMLWKELRVPLGSRIAYGEFGKPYLSDYPEAHFNISHSGQYTACVVCNRPVGVDVQMIAEYSPKVANRVCSKAELAKIVASNNPAAEFTKLWTRKEAYTKLIGEGIGRVAFITEQMDYVHLTTYSIKGAFLSVACSY